MLTQHFLLTIYKSFVQSNHGYDEVLYDQPKNDFMTKN